MNKYTVTCFAIHDKEIKSIDIFDTEEEAYNFMVKDAKDVYEEEINNNDKDAIFEDYEDSVEVSSCNNEYVWIWDISFKTI